MGLDPAPLPSLATMGAGGGPPVPQLGLLPLPPPHPSTALSRAGPKLQDLAPKALAGAQDEPGCCSWEWPGLGVGVLG